MIYRLCTIWNGGYADTLCKDITDICGGIPTKSSKGIYIRRMVDCDGNDIGRAIVVKHGKYSMSGVYMNFCIFCGGKLIDK